jgi:hypothetical protein
MPDKWPLANGNWSNAANWNGGTKPVAGDDVFADGRTLNVDESFDVNTLRTSNRGGGTSGGSFNFNTAGVTGTVTSILIPGATNMVQVTATTGTVTISLGGSVAPRTSTSLDVLILHSGNCNLNLSGTNFNGITGTSTASTTTCISKTSAGLITITGNLNGGAVSGQSSNRSLVSTNGNTIVIGDVTGGANGTISRAIDQSVGTLTITGNVTGGQAAATNQGVAFTGTSLTVNGTILGGTAASAIDSSATTNNITGSIIGGAAAAIGYTAAGLLSISGSCTAGVISPAVVSTNASATNIFTGPFVNTNDTMAVQCVDMVLTADASTSWNFGDITLFSPERLAFYPSASDIRQGTTYADGTVSGSLAMPPATAVIAGTPTDNTTGSAVLTPTQLQDAVWGRDLSQMTETGSIGNRLARVSTTGTTGAQIASYLL